jgi:hypothetical protein
MKFKFILLIACIVCVLRPAYSQKLNWEALQPTQRHIINVNIGWDYGITLGAGYGYQLKTKMPVILNVSHSSPFGKNVTDDFKSKIGAEVRFYRLNHIHFSTAINSVFRRYQSPLVSLSNFGGEVSLTTGYYRKKYFVAAEGGFDKAIVTHFKHSNSFKDVFPTVQDGWYEPATGGNFHYGIKTGFSMKNNNLCLRLGKVVTQDLKITPLIPFYAELGYSLTLSSKKK